MALDANDSSTLFYSKIYGNEGWDTGSGRAQSYTFYKSELAREVVVVAIFDCYRVSRGISAKDGNDLHKNKTMTSENI